MTSVASSRDPGGGRARCCARRARRGGKRERRLTRHLAKIRGKEVEQAAARATSPSSWRLGHSRRACSTTAQSSRANGEEGRACRAARRRGARGVPVDMDVSAAFRAAARAHALERKIVATPDRADQLVAPRTLPPPSSRSPVLKSAHDTLALVRELGAFVAKHRSQYLREDKDADAVRDGIESEVRLSVQACQAHVDMLKSTVQEHAAARADGPQGIAHIHGVVLILTEYLARVAAAFDRCREVRFKRVLAEAERKRRRAPAPKATPRPVPSEPSPAASSTAPHDDQHHHQQQQQMVPRNTEGDLLVEELTGLVEQVRRAESQVVEMSALSSLFATHVQAQAAQIETLYAQAVESTRRLESGNVELRKTIARRGDSQMIVGLILFVATFSILFLDWISG